MKNTTTVPIQFAVKENSVEITFTYDPPISYTLPIDILKSILQEWYDDKDLTIGSVS